MGASDSRNAELRRLARDYRHAVQSGDLEAALLAKRRYEHVKAGGAFMVALALLLLSGCRTVRPPVVLSEHCSFPAPGYVVPPLPEGEARWLLLTVPTGVEMMLPTDFPREDLLP